LGLVVVTVPILQSLSVIVLVVNESVRVKLLLTLTVTVQDCLLVKSCFAPIALNVEGLLKVVAKLIRLI
jgi:hypothetical protein